MPFTYTCEFCGGQTRAYKQRQSPPNFCSHSCSASRIRTPLAERFWGKVSIVDDVESCWLWTGVIDKQTGYGGFNAQGRCRSAHRVSWELANGPIDDGLCVLHRCDVRACVRPGHLWLGTIADNNRDMWSKGRGVSADRKGEKHPSAILTNDLVRIVRDRVAAGETRRSVALDVGVHPSTINLAVNRKTWSHV